MSKTKKDLIKELNELEELERKVANKNFDTDTKKKLMQEIIFKFGVGMVSDQTKLFLGVLKAEETEITQGKKITETIDEILKLVDTVQSETKREIYSEMRKWAKNHNMCSDLVATSDFLRYLDQLQKENL